MPAARKDLTHDAGTSLRLAIQYLNPDETPINAASMTGDLSVLDNKGTSFFASDVTGTQDGWFDFTHLISTDTLPEGKYTYNVYVSNGTERDRLLFGQLNVRGDTL